MEEQSKTEWTQISCDMDASNEMVNGTLIVKSHFHKCEISKGWAICPKCNKAWKITKKECNDSTVVLVEVGNTVMIAQPTDSAAARAVMPVASERAAKQLAAKEAAIELILMAQAAKAAKETLD